MQEGDKELIELAFSKKKADDRKEWLRTYRVCLVLQLTIAWSLSRPYDGQNTDLGFHQQGTHSIQHGRQYSIYPLGDGRIQARSEESPFRLFQAKLAQGNQGT